MMKDTRYKMQESGGCPSPLRNCGAANYGKKKTLLFASCFLILTFSPESAFSEIYKWVDDKGEAHFTDNPAAIPEQYLNQVNIKPAKPVTTPSTPPLLRETDKDGEGKEAVIEKSPPPVKEEAIMKEGVSPDDPNAVTVSGAINEEAIENRRKVVYSGMAKNNSNTELSNVEVIFTIMKKDGKEESLSSAIKGKKGEGILESGETASFAIQPETPFPSIAGYGYNFKWRFTTTEPK